MSLNSIRAIAGRAALALRGRPAKALILLYHRLGDDRYDPWSLGVSPARFAQHMQLLSRRMRPMSLHELIERMRRKTVPSRAVAVTFDDGYAAHMDEMTRASRTLGIPLTTYICTGPLLERREFWWDTLSRVLFESERLPDTLRIDVGGREVVRALGDDAVCSAERVAQNERWRVWDPAPGARARLYKELYDLLFDLDAPARASLVERLMEWSGGAAEPRESHRVVTPDELSTLAREPDIEIGAHTITHSPLVRQSREAQRREITESRQTIESIIGRRVATFAYPFGRRSDYDDETVDLLRESGFSYACANMPAAADEASPQLELPRVQVQNWSPELLSQRLDKWLSA